MRLVLYKEQVGGMLVGVTPRPFWYVSLAEPVVVVHLYLFRRRPAGRGGGGGGGVLIFFRPSQPSRQISSVGTCPFFFVCKPVVIGGRAEQENLKYA